MEIKTAKYIEILELCPKNEIGERLHKELYNSTYITHEIVFNDKSLTLLDKNQALEQLQSVVYQNLSGLKPRPLGRLRKLLTMYKTPVR